MYIHMYTVYFKYVIILLAITLQSVINPTAPRCGQVKLVPTAALDLQRADSQDCDQLIY